MFLMVKGARAGVIKGEAQDESHKGEIDVLSWSWGMQARSSLGGGTATGKATMQDLKIVKRIDSASTALMAALRTNEPIQKAVLTLRKAGKSQLEFLKITIENGRVVSLTIAGGDEQGGHGVLEHVSFSFNQITVEYTPQGKDGPGDGRDGIPRSVRQTHNDRSRCSRRRPPGRRPRGRPGAPASGSAEQAGRRRLARLPVPAPVRARAMGARAQPAQGRRRPRRLGAGDGATCTARPSAAKRCGRRCSPDRSRR